MAQQWIRTQGRLVYEAPRGADFKKTFKLRTLTVDLPYDDLSAYYRWFVMKRFALVLSPPMFGLHVTVVRGNEKIPNVDAWKKHQGEIVTFEYSPKPHVQYGFWTLPVRSPRMVQLRKELGLNEVTAGPHSLHLTFGRVAPIQPFKLQESLRSIQLKEEFPQAWAQKIKAAA